MAAGRNTYHQSSSLENSLTQLAISSKESRELHRLITSVPAKTLHQYTLNRLREATNPSTPSAPEHHLSQASFTAIADFFVGLHPPPKCHCVRCHEEYFEIENDDRSCTVPHDDNSTFVECVGRGVKKGCGRMDESEYKTLWQCCGKTVEGDGGQGPPDGWCYEGKHTVNQTRVFGWVLIPEYILLD